MKRKYIIFVSSLLILAVVSLGVYSWSEHRRAEMYKSTVMHNYEHAFSELVTSVSQMNTALQKSVYATSPSMVNTVCTEVFGKAMTAQMSLGVMPFSSVEMEQTAAFISKVGDYAYSLSRSAGEEGYSDEQLENLKSLSAMASVLSQNLIQIHADMSGGVITMDDILQSEKKLDKAEKEALPATIGDGMRLIEKEFPEAPELIYDGPFSSHLENCEPKLLKGLESVTQEQARERCAKFLGVNADRLTFTGQSEGKLPAYYYSMPINGGEIELEVSVRGGIVINMLCSTGAGEPTMTEEDAVEIAARYLYNRGYKSMKKSYCALSDNILTINFAYEQDGVVCYSDLVKVGVAMDTGNIVGFEAIGYLMNHYERDIPEIKVSAEAARGRITDSLKILSEGLAVIPSAGNHEIFCHEFICEAQDGGHYIEYINAISGNQEKILILIEDETGTLTM